jgi:hypothetical protein
VFGTRRDPASRPVAVIAIDEETYETAPFKGSPTLTWTTEVGRVLNAVIDGGASVVGFDIVFPSTTIAASEMTVALTGSAFTWRELDAIRVQGRSTPVRIYELMAAAGQETPQQAASAAAYAEGLAHWRNREFDVAAKCFERAAGADTPSALFLARAKAFTSRPPGPDWEPVNTLEGKWVTMALTPAVR